jgi:BolA protein
MSMIEQLRTQLNRLALQHLELEDESHLHSRGLESHFIAVVVSVEFLGLSAVKRHQRVYTCLSELMPQIHALALHTYTTDEWAKLGHAPESPRCLGGSKHDH